jgi:hypothetical protein
MEGGFSKTLLMATEDGSEYIVKIPCPNAGRPMYCTASEVAVLSFSEKNFRELAATPQLMDFRPISTKAYDDSCSQGSNLELRYVQCSGCRVHHHGKSPRSTGFQEMV